MQNQKNLSTVRFYFAQCVFNHKVYEKAVERLRKYINIIFYINLFILIVSIVLMILSFHYKEEILLIFSVAILMLSIVITSIKWYFKFENQETNYVNSAKEFLHLRDLYMLLIRDILNNEKSEIILNKERQYVENYRIICFSSPKTTATDYKKARESLNLLSKNKEEFTWSDTEIDKFLPEHLRSKNYEKNR